jgi:hypothetical protein
VRAFHQAGLGQRGHEVLERVGAFGRVGAGEQVPRLVQQPDRGAGGAMGERSPPGLGEQPARRQRGAGVEAQCRGGLAPLAGQPGVHGLDGVGDPCGEAGPLGGGQQRQHGFPDQLVLEGVPVGQMLVGLHELGAGVAVEVGEQLTVGQPGDRLGDGEGEAATQDGGDRQQFLGRGAERGDPPGHGPREGGRHVGGWRVGHPPAGFGGHEQAAVDDAAE